MLRLIAECNEVPQSIIEDVTLLSEVSGRYIQRASILVFFVLVETETSIVSALRSILGILQAACLVEADCV